MKERIMVLFRKKSRKMMNGGQINTEEYILLNFINIFIEAHIFEGVHFHHTNILINI